MNDAARLTDIFKAGPLQQWAVEDIIKDQLMKEETADDSET